MGAKLPIRNGLISVLGLSLASGAVQAQQSENQVADSYIYATPFYAEPDDERGADDGFGVGLGYGWRLTERLSLEGQLFGTAFDTDQENLTDFFQVGGGVDLRFEPFPGGFSPYGLAGIGGVHNNVVPDSEDETSFFANLGVGLLSPALDNGLRFRLEGRYIHDRFDFQGSSNMGDWRVGLGVQVPLGGTRVVEKEVVREKEVTRTVPAAIKDSDGDGVPDQNDQCPDTLEGLATNNRGCVAETADEANVVRLEGVTFELESARLRPSSRDTLDRAVKALRGEPNLRVEIAGHTDSTGTAEYNQRLSERRARAVRDYLIGKGIDAGRLEARGYGESRPTVSNETRAGRMQNRRVEFRVLN